jgi:hypothetical protein
MTVTRSLLHSADCLDDVVAVVVDLASYSYGCNASQHNIVVQSCANKIQPTHQRDLIPYYLHGIHWLGFTVQWYDMCMCFVVPSNDQGLISCSVHACVYVCVLA